MFRLGTRQAFRPLGRSLHGPRAISTSRITLNGAGIKTGAISLTALAGAAVYIDQTVLPDERTPLSTLLRTYLVYSLCSLPPFVDYAPALLEACVSVPGLKQWSEAVVRRTFFAQFVGGETCQETVPIIASLRRQRKGTLLAYNVESDEENPENGTTQWKKNIEEVGTSIDCAGDFEDTHGQPGAARKTWVAIKLSGLVPSAESLRRMSAFLLRERPRDDVPYPGTPKSFDFVVFNGSKERLREEGLTEEDIDSLRTVYEEMRKLCIRAQSRGVRLIIDAEYSWYQPGIDAFVLALSREFNLPRNTHMDHLPNEQPLIYGSYQAYLRRTPAHLARSIQDAEQFGYSLGVKLVRGAYIKAEVAEHANKADGSDCPVWPNKAATDACYNSCVTALVDNLASSYAASSETHGNTKIGILLGTHNGVSCAHILECLVNSGLAHKDKEGKLVVKDGVDDHVCVGSLYGMRDDLANWMADSLRARSPMALKYVPYGSMADVMPYLARRAIENRSVLWGEGGAASERRMAGNEIRKRLLG